MNDGKAWSEKLERVIYDVFGDGHSSKNTESKNGRGNGINLIMKEIRAVYDQIKSRYQNL